MTIYAIVIVFLSVYFNVGGIYQISNDSGLGWYIAWGYMTIAVMK